MPFFIYLPGATEPGRKVDRIAAHIDVAPTVLDLCGVPAREAAFDGRSLRPLLQAGGEKSWEDRQIYSHYEPPRIPPRSTPAPSARSAGKW